MATEQDNLEPIDPRTAQELYLDHKRTECTEATVRNHKYHTNYLVDWCEENGVDNLNELTWRNLQEIRLWRKEVGDINLLTLNNHMSTLRVFLKWAASIEAVPENLYDKVMVPRVAPEDEQADETLDGDRAREILEYLSAFEYASLDHVLFGILWEAGLRIGAVRGLDVGDVSFDSERLKLVHQPDQGTTLKNGPDGERLVALSPELTDVLRDYVERVGHDVSDEYDREPLIASEHGRLARSSIRRVVYKVTAPCYRNEPCPDCVGADGKCGESVSPTRYGAAASPTTWPTMCPPRL